MNAHSQPVPASDLGPLARNQSAGAGGGERIRIVLAEDHALVRDGTRRILEQQPDLEVVGEAGDGQEAMSLITRLQPDVAILDIRMPGANAVDVARHVRERCPKTRIVILTAYDDDDFVTAALECGAHAYLLKTARSPELVNAVRTVHAGGMVLDPSVGERMARLRARRFRDEEAGSTCAPNRLTPREMAVLRLAAEGLRNREIACRLGVSPRTVEAHFSSILGKLGVVSRTAAVMYASTHGWLESGDT